MSSKAKGEYDVEIQDADCSDSNTTNADLMRGTSRQADY